VDDSASADVTTSRVSTPAIIVATNATTSAIMEALKGTLVFNIAALPSL